MANETLLPSRAHKSTSSSVQASTHRDSILDRLSRTQFHDSRSRGSSRASASATRDVDSLQSTRAAFLGESRDASLNVSRGAVYRDFGDPNMASSPRRPFEDSPGIPLRLDRGQLPRMRTFYGKSFEQSTCQTYWFEVCLRRLHGPFCQTNHRITSRCPWPWTTTFSRSYSMPSRHQNLIQDWSNRILPFAFHKLCIPQALYADILWEVTTFRIPQAPTFYRKSQPLVTFTSHFPTFYGKSQPHKSQVTSRHFTGSHNLSHSTSPVCGHFTGSPSSSQHARPTGPKSSSVVSMGPSARRTTG